jgi:hypothetical protein
MKNTYLFFWKNLGHCVVCMGISLRVFVFLFILSLVAFVVPLPGSIIFLAELATLTAGLLWVAHVVIFSIKVAQARKRRKISHYTGRREFLALLGKSAVVAMAPIITTALPNSAWAKGASENTCYCCADESPENCECTTPYDCKDAGLDCSTGGNCP